MARATTPWSRGALDFDIVVDLRDCSNDEDHQDFNCLVLEDDSDSLTPVGGPISKAHNKKGSSSELEDGDSSEDTVSIPDDDEPDFDIKPEDLTVYYGEGDILTTKEDDALDGEKECDASDENESTLEGYASLSGDEKSPNSSRDGSEEVDPEVALPVEMLNGKVDELISDPLGDNPGGSSSGQEPGEDRAVGNDEDSSSIPDHEPENIEKVGDELVGDELVGDELVGDELVGDKSVGDELVGDELVGDFKSNQRKRSHSEAEVDEDVKLKLSINSAKMDVNSGSRSKDEEDDEKFQPVLDDFSPRGCCIL